MNQLAQVLRLASTLACGIVVVAFVLWATDETKTVSEAQAAQVETGAAPSAVQPPAPADPAAEPQHDGLRGAIESANEALLAPFDGVTQSTNEWAVHGVPMLLALLTYGLLARLLIVYLPQQR